MVFTLGIRTGSSLSLVPVKRKLMPTAGALGGGSSADRALSRAVPSKQAFKRDADDARRNMLQSKATTKKPKFEVDFTKKSKEREKAKLQPRRVCPNYPCNKRFNMKGEKAHFLLFLHTDLHSKIDPGTKPSCSAGRGCHKSTFAHFDKYSHPNDHVSSRAFSVSVIIFIISFLVSSFL